MECACKQISIQTQKKWKFPVPETQNPVPRRNQEIKGDKGDYLQHVLKLPLLCICFKAAETEIRFKKALGV